MIFENIFKKKEKKPMTVVNARNLFDFGSKDITFEEVVNKEINKMEERIGSTCRLSNRLICQILPNTKLKVTDKVVEHFKEEGFVAKVEKFEEVPDYHVLIIGW